MYSTGAEGVGGVKLSTGRTWSRINGFTARGGGRGGVGSGGMYIITWSFASWIDLPLYDVSLSYYIPQQAPTKAYAHQSTDYRDDSCIKKN